MMAAKIAGAPIVRPPAEQRGYVAAPVDELGGTPEHTGRPLAGFTLRNEDGDGMWIPIEDLSALGDLLIRLHVQAARARGKR